MKKYIATNDKILHANLKWDTIFKRLEDIADFRYDPSAIFKWDDDNDCYLFYSTNIKSIFLKYLCYDGYLYDLDYLP